MKKLLVVLMVLGLFSFMSPQQSRAHSDDAGWFAAGAFAGVLTGAVLADSSCHRTYYAEPCYRPVYRPVVYRPYYGHHCYRSCEPRYDYYDEYCD